MSSKGTLCPSNVTLQGSGHSLLDRLDFFFGDPKRGQAVGEFLQQETAAFKGFDNNTNSEAGLVGYALFKRYGELIDTLLTGFCVDSEMKVEEVAAAAMNEMTRLDGAPSQFICLPYICAALDMDAFCRLVDEMQDILNYGFDEVEAEDADVEEAEEAGDGAKVETA
eukprot:GILI01020841.1.p1 GENE.GILI01020841.1~~GILI01020841.1.p1  ORF type:complete len:167 (+),score=45.33 GILI01020841.1:47-547(+)